MISYQQACDYLGSLISYLEKEKQYEKYLEMLKELQRQMDRDAYDDYG